MSNVGSFTYGTVGASHVDLLGRVADQNPDLVICGS
jgi:hypothetical protein